MEEQNSVAEKPTNENSLLSENVNEESIGNDRSLEDFQLEVGNVLERLEIDDLTELRRCFFEKVVDETIKEPKGSAHPRFCGFKLTKEEFLNAIESVIGSNAYSASAIQLFEEINKKNSENHQGFIWWEQILDAIIEQEERLQKTRLWSVIRETMSQLHHLTYCKRETIIRVVPIETRTSFCYVMVSKYGRIGIYDWKINLLEQYEVKLGAAQDGEARRTTWLTDAVYLPDATTLLLSASDRSLHFFSASGLVHVPIFLISGLQNTPTCLNYTVGKTNNDPSKLLIGDDHGAITTLSFHQPEFCLFERVSTDKMDKYFWTELETQEEWVSTEVAKVHFDEVLKLEFMPEYDTIVSCSNDPHTSLVIRHRTGRRAPYIFKMSRGVRCFHLDHDLKILVTGSKDSVVRLWNPVMTNKPTASLFGHKSAIVDVRILRNLTSILSMSKDATLKVWDINDECCLQSLPTLFPVYGGTGRTAKFGMQTFYPGPVGIGPPSEKNQKSTHKLPVQKSHPASLLSSTSATKQERSSGINSSETSVTSDNETEKDSSQLISEENSDIKENLSVVEVEETIVEKSDLEEASVCEAQWNRMEILAVCCNFVVLLRLGDGEILEGANFISAEPLPPPLREQDPAVPSPWLTADPPTQLVSGSHSLLSSNSSLSSPIPLPRLEIIRKSIGEGFPYQFRPVSSPKLVLQAEKAEKYASQKRVRALVEQCAPHLALNLSHLEDIRLSQVLPVSSKMRNLDLSNPENLLKAKIKTESLSSVLSKPSYDSTSTTSRSMKYK